MRSGSLTRSIDLLWLLCFGLLGSAWCLTAAGQIGPTYDEPFYLESGLNFWHTGSLKPLLDKGAMPLPMVVTTAPVRAAEVIRGRPFDLGSEFDEALHLARTATLLFWWLLLLYGYLAGRHIAGPWGGRLAVALLACEPTLLAHAALASTDIALSACLLAFAVHFHAGRDSGWVRRVGLPALFYAIALLAKASALVFGVLVMLTLEGTRLWSAQPADAGQWQKLRACLRGLLARSLVKEVAGVVALGLALTFLACGSDFFVLDSFVEWADSLPAGPGRTSMVWLAEHAAVFSNAGVAIVRQIKHNMQGHGAYLLGVTSPRALWYYFPVALTIKLALPLLLLPVALALLSPRSLGNPAQALAAVLLLFSLNCRVQIGIRLVFPLVVFAAIGTGAALADALARVDLTPWRRRLLGGLTCVGVAWMAVAAGSAWPNGLCYVNELYGGPRRGYRLVSGSDYDWGQGIPELARWQRRHHASLTLLYYGTDPLADAAPFQRLRVDSFPPPDAPHIRAALAGREVAVSLCLLHGPSLRHERLDALLGYLRTCRPADRTTCFFIYRFPPQTRPDARAAVDQGEGR